MTTLTAAAVRLAVSRERLRQALHERPAPRSAPAGEGGAAGWDALRSVPGAALVIDAVRAWWAGQPWRTAAGVVAGAVRAQLQPLAQRHPVGLVLAAMAAGGLLAWTRPWRWIGRAAPLAAWLPELAAGVLARLPLASWLAVLAELSREAPARPEPPV
jgi:hypothetical protein